MFNPFLTDYEEKLKKNAQRSMIIMYVYIFFPQTIIYIEGREMEIEREKERYGLPFGDFLFLGSQRSIGG